MIILTLIPVHAISLKANSVFLDTEFISKGDSNNINDKVQSLDKIHGKVIFHSKVCGIFILYMLKPITIIYLLYIIVLEIYCRSKESKHEEIAK